eukprot:TRINITY_DN7021_c0_g1_i4.p1 TRINITY_DN7021_c0_g1~~TRINITY_DN7021_c0_g1_i4.p1  ORF type:complete len:126 (-),score=37.48 TRINITY_DN7021_c0_g1_i4:52-429(-)
MDFKRRNTNEGDAAGGSGSAWKKPRGPSMHDDEGFGPTPDEDFGDDMFDPDEGADLEPDLDLDADHHFDGGVDEKTFKQASWIRPPLVMPNPATDSVESCLSSIIHLKSPHISWIKLQNASRFST